MLIKDLFEEATKNDYVDLQALIMFLVFEKEVLSMESNTKELDIYFLEKHSERMNHELRNYKKKMNINYGLQVFAVINDKKTNYILAYTEKQARFIASEHLIKVDHIKICNLDDYMTYNGTDMTFRTLIEGKKPSILGTFDHSSYKSLRGWWNETLCTWNKN